MHKPKPVVLQFRKRAPKLKTLASLKAEEMFKPTKIEDQLRHAKEQLELAHRNK